MVTLLRQGSDLNYFVYCDHERLHQQWVPQRPVQWQSKIESDAICGIAVDYSPKTGGIGSRYSKLIVVQDGYDRGNFP